MQVRSAWIMSAIVFCVFITSWGCQTPGVRGPEITYHVDLTDTSSKKIHVEMHVNGLQNPAESVILKMPVWTPGYYQFMNYSRSVEVSDVTDQDGNPLQWETLEDGNWKLTPAGATGIVMKYSAPATRSFIATNYIHRERAFISPTALFPHIDGRLDLPSRVEIAMPENWTRVATGLDHIGGAETSLEAPDFDTLYDSPILAGILVELPSFEVRGIPHRFIAYKPGNFDYQTFIDEVEQIVVASSDLIGHIPYKHYTFMGIGPGRGGLEHLNSTAISFSGDALDTNRAERVRMMNFIAHEYFHHYNVKRIRPIELGPFDYEQGSRTKGLWVAEGLTVYYEYLVMRRAGIASVDETLADLLSHVNSYENKPGKQFQSLVESSYETWEDGPFGRSGDEAYKSISYYEKGPIVGWLMDFAIRNHTNNEKSLDDVMRHLYHDIYLGLDRGFTEDEVRDLLMDAGGPEFSALMDYVYTTNALDYEKYLGYAGFEVHADEQALPGAYIGWNLNPRAQNGVALVTSADFESPAWEAGIRSGAEITRVNGRDVNRESLQRLVSALQPGASLSVTWKDAEGATHTAELSASVKTTVSYSVSRVANPTPLQEKIYRSWAYLE